VSCPAIRRSPGCLVLAWSYVQAPFVSTLSHSVCIYLPGGGLWDSSSQRITTFRPAVGGVIPLAEALLMTASALVAP